MSGTFSTDLTTFQAEAEAWLSDHAERAAPRSALKWGEGDDDVSLFKDMTPDEERAHIGELRSWQQCKSDAGYGSISWPTAYGGGGLSPTFDRSFSALERRFVTPAGHEAVTITMELVAPTILAAGTDEQRSRYVELMRRTDEMWCQLFSEPDAGSDLASVRTSARLDGEQWTLNGQKVWTSGAQNADFGYILCRTDPDAPSHNGLTAFILPMHAPGVEVRPLRQMTGGSSFNEVYLTDVVVPEANRLGGVGEGWKVAILTLGFERAAATSSGKSGSELFDRLVLAATHNGRNNDPVVRQRLADLYVDGRVRTMTRQRAESAMAAGQVPGPEGSLGKLAWTQGLRKASEAASEVLGLSLQAETDQWGTYAWSRFVNGVPGFRVAGGTDEVQRNILAERVLGLPRDPRPTK